MQTLLPLARTIAARLIERKETIGIAEGSAGGLIAASLLSVPGASAYFVGGAVVYTGPARAAFTGITPDDMKGLRPATEAYAALMARKLRERLGTTWTLAEAGAAGPSGNRYGDPAGHTCIAVAGPSETTAMLRTGNADRETNMRAFARRALEVLAQQVGAMASPVATSWPSDIDPKSGFRLPLPPVDQLDEAGRVAYERATKPGATIAGLQGPAGIALFSPKTAAHHNAINRYLRFEAGFTPYVREVAILATAREMDSQFEWVAHEPEALKEGVPQNVIDVIKHRRSTEGLNETDAAIIQLGREIWRDHKVKAETFAKVKAIFGANKAVELVMLMGNYAGTAALLAAVDMQLHAGKKPMMPVP